MRRQRAGCGAALAIVMLGCSSPPPPDPEPGIALALAEQRARTIQNLRYALTLDLPAAPTEPVAGRIVIRFTRLEGEEGPVVLDFAAPPDHVRSVKVGGRSSAARLVHGHIVIPAGELRAGETAIDIEFRAGDAALNRNPDFLYALFVPARAQLTFPCFDQPDLKARFTLELTTPVTWQAVANGAELSREPSGDRMRRRYAETEPIPTYLFSFAAGQFTVETAERQGRTYRMLHRETDAAKVARNRDQVFNLHSAALAWLEDYTAIPYPFGKFDFVLIPSFQFGGMEHPGTIFYNAASILLDESATENQMLGRASLIAHETAHMWFGDLVTMRWFNDVWMKEVFANFMAAKIVNPAFPRVNHDLRFLVAHYPAAYGVDRTAGTHPIRQPLANLNEAGSLYGAIIYQKAPIVMRQLERLLGADRLQQGLRVYLKDFAFGNATWLDLVGVLDERTDRDLAAWSRTWVEEAGRPAIRTELELDETGSVRRLTLVQSDPQPQRSLRWIEQLEVVVGRGGSAETMKVELTGERAEVAGAAAQPKPDFILPNGGGLGYGAFELDEGSRAHLVAHVHELKDPVTRGAAWVTLWDELLEGRVPPADFLAAALRALPAETTEQNVQLVTGYARETFWRFLAAPQREEVAARLERTLLDGLRRATTSSLKAAYFSAFRSIVTTPGGVAFLERVWRRTEQIPGLTLAEPDEAEMALDLAVRSVPEADAILREQRGRFMNPDRQARFEFVMPALSADTAVRDAFFKSLADVRNRRREPWVVEGVRYLNHPLRAADSLKHLATALEMLDEIRRTGDIFFPTNWMNATLGGHRSTAAADTVRAFLAARPDYPVPLRRVVLQSADDLFRATR